MFCQLPHYVAYFCQTKVNATSSEDFKLDPEEFESKFTSKTKAVLFNTPNNPLGKVYLVVNQ